MGQWNRSVTFLWTGYVSRSSYVTGRAAAWDVTPLDSKNYETPDSSKVVMIRAYNLVKKIQSLIVLQTCLQITSLIKQNSHNAMLQLLQSLMYMPECLLLKENSWGLRNEGCFYVYDCTGEVTGPWSVRIVRLLIEAARVSGSTNSWHLSEAGK